MFVLEIAERDVVVLYPGRVLGKENLRDIRQLLEDCERRGKRRFVLDFSKTEHVYYRLADLLAHHKNKLSAENGSLVLAGVSPYLKDIFTAVGYGDAFEEYDNLAEAVHEANC
ncbi:MAG: anti-sigma factor antagonist [Myxococcales bacterium]|nr:MAG: anti-sigma factor antagonist [Myxococcales bacterium]